MTNTTPETKVSNDPVNHPKHYTAHPSGVECIQITEHMGFNLGNAMKYVWRADLKNDAIEDMKKASWYIQREIDKREREAKKEASNLTGGSWTTQGLDPTTLSGSTVTFNVHPSNGLSQEAVTKAIEKQLKFRGSL